jgi:hypothetical protein
MRSSKVAARVAGGAAIAINSPTPNSDAFIALSMMRQAPGVTEK